MRHQFEASLANVLNNHSSGMTILYSYIVEPGGKKGH